MTHFLVAIVVSNSVRQIKGIDSTSNSDSCILSQQEYLKQTSNLQQHGIHQQDCHCQQHFFAPSSQDAIMHCENACSTPPWAGTQVRGQVVLLCLYLQ